MNTILQRVYDIVFAAVSAGVIAALTILLRQARKSARSYTVERDAIHSGLVAVLRAEIIRIYNHCGERGYCPIYERENLDDLFREYTNLGGNGTIPALIEKVKVLPTEKPYGRSQP